MAEQENSSGSNPFDGMSFGQAVLHLRAKPELAKEFDAAFKDIDQQTVDTLERARLHSVDGFYRGTLTGAARLRALANIAKNPPQEQPQLSEEQQLVADAAEAAAGRTRKQYKKQVDPLVPLKDQYTQIVGDLARYDVMAPAKTFEEYAAAIGGQLTGGLPTIENIVGFGARGATAVSKMLYSAIMTGGTNMAVDPLVQELSIGTGVQKEFDPLRFVLSGPVGAVIGGGLAGLGHVVSRDGVRSIQRELAIDDPQFRSPEIFKPEEEAQVLEFNRKKGGGIGTTQVPEMVRPDSVPTPVDHSPKPIKALQAQVQEIERLFDVNIREGRVSKTTHAGEYQPGTGIIRIQEYPDFEVAVHEMAHAIEPKVEGLTNLTKQFANELDKLDYAYDPLIGGRTSEGFAEWVRAFVGNPAYAQKQASGFTQAFFNHMEKTNPEYLDALVKTSQAYNEYLRAPDTDVARAVQVSHAETDKSDFKKWMERKKEQGFPEAIKTVMDDPYRWMFDRHSPMAQFLRRMASDVKEATGKIMKRPEAGDDPETLIRAFDRYGQTALDQMRNGITPYRHIKPQGPSLQDAMITALGKNSMWGRWDSNGIKEFGDYLIAKRAMVLWDKFDRGELPNPPIEYSKETAENIVQELGKKKPEYEVASQQVHDYARNLLERAKDAGLLKQEQFDRIIQDPFYVPFMRDLSDKPLAGGAGGAAGELVGRQKGSSRRVYNPIESLMLQTLMYERNIQHNDIITSMLNYSKSAGRFGGKYMEEIPAHEARKYTFDLTKAFEDAAKKHGLLPDDIDSFKAAMSDMFGDDPVVGSFFRMEQAAARGEPIVFFRQDGDLKAARVISKDEGLPLYEMLTTMPKQSADVARQILTIASNTFVRGITVHPVYAAFNWMRDQIVAGIMVRGYIPFYHGVRGIKHELAQDEVARLYNHAGGVSPGMQIAPVESAIEADVNALAKQGRLGGRLVGHNMSETLKKLTHIVSMAESGTRLSVFEKVFNEKKKHGLNDYDAMIEARRVATDLLDFGRYGDSTLTMRTITPFLNAWAQGMDKARRQMVAPVIRKILNNEVLDTDSKEFNDAIASWIKLSAVGGGLGFTWAALNWHKENYRDAAPNLKGANVIVPIGDKVWLWPKPWELGLGFTAGEYAFAKLMKNDPRAGQMMIESAYDVMKPPIPIASNPLIKTGYELYSGVNMFTGRPIIPQRLENVAPEYQFTERTSDLSKGIAGVLRKSGVNVSPMKVEHAIGSLFTQWGRDTMALSRGMDEDSIAGMESRAITQRFVKDPSVSADYVTKFWEKMSQSSGKFTQAVKTYDKLVGELKNDAEARKYYSKLPENIKAWVLLHSAAGEDGKPAFKRDDRRIHPLARAYDAVSVLNKLRRELDNGTYRATGDDPNVLVKLSLETRKELRDRIATLAQQEMRNALTITKEPGYADRPLFDTAVTFATISVLSPEVAKEIATRYATRKIYKTTEIAKNYERLQREVLSSGSNADLDPIRTSIVEQGYEFEGERVSRPNKRRVRM